MNNINTSNVSIVGESFFALPHSPETSNVVLISAPWDVTVSYGKGTADAPEQLLIASAQLDLFDAFTTDAWQHGIATIPIDTEIKALSVKYRKIAEQIITHLESGGDPKDVEHLTQKVNEASHTINKHIEETSLQWIKQNKIVGLVGGDHSTPLGYIRALGIHHTNFGILHIDAHRDLREAYEGFESSHASIMYNAINSVPQIDKLVQVAVRDFCDEEQHLADTDPRIVSFTDRDLSTNQFNGTTWAEQCHSIVSQLPQKVYISFDIDGLDIAYCPSTGTPVPGGLSFNQAIHLLEEIVRQGKQIIGFDLVEIVPNSVADLSVGARLLLKLSTLAIMSNKQ